MNCSKQVLILTAVLAAVAFSAPGPAEAALVDYVGFGWETGGFPDSEPGDELTVVCVSTQIDALFGVDLGVEEATLVLSGLISSGSTVDPGTGWLSVNYDFGILELYADPTMDHAWGLNPPSGSSPGSFSNGELLFRGEFTSFSLVMTGNGSGIFEGQMDGVAGSALGTLCTGCAYGFGAVFTLASGAQIPEGYDIQVDGTLDINSAVPVAQNASWGSLKARY